jgi:DNA polymerase IIIc chi subunit
MQPVAMLNSQVENPIGCLESTLDAKNRMHFLPHSIAGKEAQQNVQPVVDGTADGGQASSESGQTTG